MKFLQNDTPIASLLGRILDLLLINIMWFLCCIPIVTIGASTAAMYAMTTKLALQEDNGIILGFFKCFKQHFGRATGLYAIAVAAGAFIAVDLWCAINMTINMKYPLMVVVLAVGYFYLATLSHAIPALVYFERPVFETIKLGFLFAMKNGFRTILVMILDLLPFLLLFFNQQLFQKSFFIWITVGFAVVAYINTIYALHIFDPERMKELNNQEHTT